MKNIVKIVAALLLMLPSAGFAQMKDKEGTGLFDKMKENQVFSTVEIAANIGTTGIGFELASPVTKWTKLRVGVDFMPNVTIPMTFGLDSYDGDIINNKFDQIADMMYDMTGLHIDKDVKMDSKLNMTTLRVLLDVYPFRNKHWHITAGFFYGGHSIGTSMNTIQEMPSLLALQIYDRMYTNYSNPDYFIDNPLFGNVYLDPEIAMELSKKVEGMGRLGIHVGDFPDGKPYLMTPGEDGTVSAKAYVNRFRPYVGFGYGGALTKDGRWQASFDAGVQFWGGAPKVTTHDGVVLNDLTNLRKKVDNYMNLMKMMTVYPTIDFRISYRF